MFSPAQNTAPSATVRSSRRRQRPLSNEGSISQPNAKRQRSALSAKTFLPPDADGSPEMEDTRNSRIATLPRHELPRDIPGLQKDMAVRGRKVRTGDQGNKGDGSVVLTTNDTYTVSKLPALPDRLRADVTGRQHGAIDSESGYALAFTHTHAVVWPYAVNMSSPETFTFALPNPSKHTSDPLPLGCLVSASASSSDPGLVVVIPSTGKITYWESISSAATLDLRLQRSGVELTIPGLLSGELAIQILNAESAGFILGFSTGRIAYMSVRDGQGRPTISVQFLRGTGGSGGGGLFGSLRNALSASAWRGDIAAIRAGRPDKVGERDVVVATAKGKLQAWNVHRGGHTSLTLEADGREAIVMAIKQTVPSLSELHLESFELLDFAHTPKSVVGSQLINGEDRGVQLLLLTSLKAREVSHYSLVEVTLKSNGLDIGTIRPIKSYTTPISRVSNSKARLYLPNPALISYIVFERAVVVISMARPLDSPDNQLRFEGHLAPKTFEDVIDFREEINIEIVGSGMEEPSAQTQGNEDMKARRHRPKYPATVLFVRGGGIVRVAATDTPRLLSTKPQQVTARSKLEQAVFFGTLEQNPLSFSVRSELQFSAEEVGAAALELSLDILKSQIPYIPSVPASIDQNLRKRSKALLDLAKYIKAIGVKLERPTKWKLLADAEKMAAATAIWRQYDTRLREKPVGQKRGLLTELVEFIHEDYKTEPVAEAGELDRVRHWFINDIWNLEIAVPWAYQVIKYTYQDGQKDHQSVFEIVSEANDLVIGSLIGAFDFRTASLDLYGLGDEELEHGTLKLGYEGLPEFWTSSQFITENARKQCELAGLLVKEYWEKPLGGDGQPTHLVVDKVRREHPVLIDVSIRANNERIRWAAAQELPQSQIQAEELRQVQAAAEDDQLSLLVTDLNLSDEAIDLAEKHEILPTLAQITLHEINGITKEIAAAKERREEIAISWTRRSDELRNRVRDFFEKFGSRWASAFYEQLINSGSMAELFDAYPKQQDYLTAFLRSQPEYAKLAWIQEVTREQNFDAAAKTLLDLGMQRETDLWSQKIELSMWKLARLAGRSYSESNGIIVPDGQSIDVIPIDNQLALIKIQDQVYDYVFDTIKIAIDGPAELQLALEAHGNKELKKQHRFAVFLEEAMSRLIKHESMDALTVIDLLTLMTGAEGEEAFGSVQFYLALEACRRGLTSRDEQYLVQRIIWRRCMLRDKWDQINDTDLKDDSQVSGQLRTTSLYLTFRACLQKRIFDVPSDIKPISPEDVLGAGTDELDHRFTGLDASIRETIMNDMQVEDDSLNTYIQSCRLDKWYQGTLDLARQDYEESVAQETFDGTKANEGEDQLTQVEEAIAKKERERGQRKLHSEKFKPKAKLNGNTNFRASIKQY